LPRPRRLRRRFDLAKQRDPIAAGENLERYRENTAAGVPIDLELGMVEVDAAVGALAVVEIAGIGGDTPGERLRYAVRGRSRRANSPTAAH